MQQKFATVYTLWPCGPDASTNGRSSLKIASSGSSYAWIV